MSISNYLTTAQTVQSEIIEAIAEIAGIDSIGLLSPADGNAVSFAGGKDSRQYLDGSAFQTIDLQLRGKGRDQRRAADDLFRICEKLTRIKPGDFPKTDDWEIRRITVKNLPALREQSGDGTWFYECIISADYYYKLRKDGKKL